MNEENSPQDEKTDETETTARRGGPPGGNRGRVRRGGSHGEWGRGRRGGDTWRVLAGTLLILFGITVLVERATGIDLSWIPLLIGAAFLVLWKRDRSYGFLIAGGIVTGVGAGSFVESLLNSPIEDGLSTLFLAAGFGSIWYLDGRRGRSIWAGIVAAILGVIGLFELGGTLPDFLDAQAAQLLLPAAVIVLGAVLIMRGSIPMRLYQVLVVLLLLLVIFAASARFSGGLGIELFGGVRRETTRTVSLPDLSGQTLVLEGGSGDVRVVNGPPQASARIVARGDTDSEARSILSRSRIEVDEGTETVTVRQSRSDQVAYHFTISIPPDASIRIETSSGDVTVLDAEFENGDVRTASGDIELSGGFAELSISTASGDVEGLISVDARSDVEIRTASGDVDVDVQGTDPSISIRTASGDIDVSGFEGERSRRSFERTGAQGNVTVVTASGDIDLG